jgi:hypothetical protein
MKATVSIVEKAFDRGADTLVNRIQAISASDVRVTAFSTSKKH